MLFVKNFEYVQTIKGLTDDELNKANVEGIVITPEWLSSMVVRNKITEIDKSRILEMASMLQSTYPDLWDIQVSKSKWVYKITYENISGYGLREFTTERSFYKLSFDIIIKFPEITITNGKIKDGEHVIRNLYVKFQYTQNADITENSNYLIMNQDTTPEYLIQHPKIQEHDGFYVPFKNYSLYHAIEGLRDTATKKEYTSQYTHSHLASRKDWKTDNKFSMLWSQFCLGSGEIAQSLLLIEEDFSIDLFQMILYQLEVYVKWESLDGGPYRYFRDVNKESGGVLNTLPTIAMYEAENIIYMAKDYWKRYIENNPTFKFTFNWRIQSNRPEVIIDSKFDEFLRHNRKNPDNFKPYVYYQDIEGNYYSIVPSSLPIDSDRLTKNTIVFRGEVKTFKLVEPESNNVTLNPGFVFHPEIKKILKQKLEAYGSSSEIKREITQRANQIISTRRAAKQNQVFM